MIINEKTEISTQWLAEKVGKHLIVLDNLSSNTLDVSDICVAEQFGLSNKHNMTYDECVENILLKLRGQIASSKMTLQKDLNKVKNMSLRERLFNSEAKIREKELTNKLSALASKTFSENDVIFLPLPKKMWLRGLISEGEEVFLLDVSGTVSFPFMGKCYISDVHHTDENDITEISIEYKVESTGNTFYFIHDSNVDVFDTNHPEVKVFFEKEYMLNFMEDLYRKNLVTIENDFFTAIELAKSL